ncbi:MAG: hypothetical protein L6Q95_13285 [Planctomycetes bacterium]|nr:hypothetical protein [Planctomycetota bacterium]
MDLLDRLLGHDAWLDRAAADLAKGRPMDVERGVRVLAVRSQAPNH